MASHGRRLDPTGQRRTDNRLLTPFNPAGSAYSPHDPLDVVGAHRAALAEMGAVPYGRAAIALHLLVGVSPELIREAGGLHDPRNPMNQALIEKALAWAAEVFGAGAVIAWRMDLDETGGGLVDAFLVPTRVARMNARCEKRIISVHGALEDVRLAHEARFSYSALQSSWATYAGATLDARLHRGEPKASTGRAHLPPDIYRRVCEQVASEAHARIEAREADLGELEAAAQNAIIAADRARVKAERQAEELKRDRMRLHAHAQDELDATMRALTLGIQAVSDGRIAGLEYDPHDGLPNLIRDPDLDEAAWAELLNALAPAWDRGLPTLLADLLGVRASSGACQDAYQMPTMMHR
ncbi:hypothetical protein [Methylobacterium goesingense]|uniref:Uncharacterized protein n=1 Tax=Methylobacterium goesingense TaxID=243690 RepID=A0ABV2LE65_9HYPH|nr:hypothetical protein [Methylobacterium goesingense]